MTITTHQIKSTFSEFLNSTHDTDKDARKKHVRSILRDLKVNNVGEIAEDDRAGAINALKEYTRPVNGGNGGVRTRTTPEERRHMLQVLVDAPPKMTWEQALKNGGGTRHHSATASHLFGNIIRDMTAKSFVDSVKYGLIPFEEAIKLVEEAYDKRAKRVPVKKVDSKAVRKAVSDLYLPMCEHLVMMEVLHQTVCGYLPSQKNNRARKVEDTMHAALESLTTVLYHISNVSNAAGFLSAVVSDEDYINIAEQLAVVGDAEAAAKLKTAAEALSAKRNIH